MTVFWAFFWCRDSFVSLCLFFIVGTGSRWVPVPTCVAEPNHFGPVPAPGFQSGVGFLGIHLGVVPAPGFHFGAVPALVLNFGAITALGFPFGVVTAPGFHFGVVLAQDFHFDAIVRYSTGSRL